MKSNLDILEDDKTGGPAHPCFEVVTHDTGDLVQNADQGISKRDWFAANVDGKLGMRQAMAVMGSSPPEDMLESVRWWALAEGRHRFIKADAMMEARK